MYLFWFLVLREIQFNSQILLSLKGSKSNHLFLESYMQFFNCIFFAEWWKKRQNLKAEKEKVLSQLQFSIPFSLMSQTFRRWRGGFSAFWMISTLENFKHSVSNRCLYLLFFFSRCLHPILCMYIGISFKIVIFFC